MSSDFQQAVNAFQSRDYSRAKILIERYLKITTNDSDAYMLLAAINASDRNYNEVIRLCNKVLEVTPNHVKALYNAAVACQIMSDYHGVISYTDKLLEIDATNLPVLAMRVIAYQGVGNNAASLELARNITHFGSSGLSFIYNIVAHYRANNSLDMALETINSALLLFPGDSELFISKLHVLVDMGNVSSAELMLNSTESQNVPISTIALARSYICVRSGNIKEAINILESELPAYENPAVRSELGKLYTQISDYEKAETIYSDNIQKQINLAESYHALGNIYDLRDDYDAAISAYTNALKYSPASESTYYNLALINEKKGDYAKAIECIYQSPKSTTGLLLKQMYVRILAKGGLDITEVDSSNELISLIEDEDIDPQPLSNVIVRELRNNSDIAALVNASLLGDLNSFKAALKNKKLHHLYENLLLLNTLSCVSITNYDFECFIRMLRYYLILHCGVTKNIDPNFINLCAVVGIQSFMTGYVYYESETEHDLIKSLSEKFGNKHVDNSSIQLLIVLSMYVPINRLVDNIDSEVYSGINSKYVTRLLKIQFFDRIQEEVLYSTIESPFDIVDETSVLVRNQYEDSPYPVWESLMRTIPRNVIDIIDEVSPYSDNSPFNFKDPDVLIAGCGTGSHVLLSSMRVRSKSITAIDLSKRSLAFAMRKASDYGLEKVKFLHMDLLRLPDMGMKYDIIESIGVIHHMHDPALGLACLVECLKQGGLLNLAIYSSTARRYVLKARSLFNNSDHHINDNEIRYARTDIMRSDDRAMVENISGLSDFYALHECRDLMFHECEHDYTIPDLSQLITDAGLVFIGFDFNDKSVPAAYRKMFPGGDMSNLENWDIFESKYPDTFIGMYNVWCSKL